MTLTYIACADLPEGGTTEQALVIPTITGVNYIGTFTQPNDWSPSSGPAIGSRTFEVYGVFPKTAGYYYYPHVKCDGRLWPAQILAGAGLNQMNVSIPNITGYPFSGTSCWFMFEVSDGNRPTTSVFSNNEEFFGPIAVAQDLKITSAADGGISGGVHSFTLMGPGLVATNGYTSQVSCNGATLTSSVVAKAAGAVTIEFPSNGAARDCQINLALASLQSNAWVIRDGSPSANPATVPELGAYVWGGYQSDSQPPSYTTLASIRDHLPNAAKRIADAGYRNTMRFVMTPTMRLAGNNNVRVKGPDSTATFNVFSFWLDANVYDFYGGACPIGGAPFLGCIARTAQFQGAFNAVANGGTIALTVADPATFGDVGYCATSVGDPCNTNPTYLVDTARQNRIRTEYQELAYALYETQHDTGKRFLIGNWETENNLYTGDGNQGGIYPTLAYYKSHTYMPPNNSVSDLWRRADGLITWFRLRQEGIRCGIYLATGQNYPTGSPCSGTPHVPAYSNVEVYDSIEMASMHMVQDARLRWGLNIPSTIDNIVPAVKPAYVTYSAWDSTQSRGTVDEDIDKIEVTLDSVTSPITGVSPYFALGELGTIAPAANAIHEWRNLETIKAAYRAYVSRPGFSTKGPPRMFMWQAFTATLWPWPKDSSTMQLDVNPGSNLDDGLFFANGYERSYSRTIRNALNGYAVAGAFYPRAAGDPYIKGITDLGVTQGFHYFELWGEFPTALAYQVRLNCDGVLSINADVNYVDPNHWHIQVNVPDVGSAACVNGVADGRFCTFEIRHSNSAWSPLFGPSHVCPAGASDPMAPPGQEWGGGCTQPCN